MIINERLKYFRKDMLELNQAEFASRIGLTQSGLSCLEKNGASIPDSTLKLICMTFGLSEEWLRTGEGDMYADKTPEEKLEEYLKTRGLSPASVRLVIDFINMPPELREGLTEYFQSALKMEG